MWAMKSSPSTIRLEYDGHISVTVFRVERTPHRVSVISDEVPVCARISLLNYDIELVMVKLVKEDGASTPSALFRPNELIV